MLGLALTAVFLAASNAAPFAHPLSDRIFDRSIQATVFADRLVVEYTLGVNDLTLMTDLLALVEPGQAPASTAQARKQFAVVVQPIIGRGLQIQLDDRLIFARTVSSSMKLLDHVEYHFHFEAALPMKSSGNTLKFADMNFPGERGYRRLAIRPGNGVQFTSSTVPAELSNIPMVPTWQMTPSREEAASRGTVVVTLESPAANVSNAGIGAASNHDAESPDRDSADEWSLRELLATSRTGFAAAMAFAFLFGMLHAIKPGHGKTMVAAYLVGQHGTVYHAALLGIVTTLTHTGTVLFVAFMLRPFAGSRYVDQRTLSFWLTLLSGITVAWLGAALLWRRIAGKEDLLHVHGPGGHVHLPDGSVRWESSVTTGNLLTLGFSGGLVPCDDAVLLLLAAIGAGLLAQAVFILLAFSAGLACVLVLLGILVVKFRGFAVRQSSSKKLVATLQIASAAAIALVGIGLCISALRM